MRDIRDVIITEPPPDGIYIDAINGVAGTDWPIGTPGYPVNNLADAMTIAGARRTLRSDWKLFI